MKDFFEMVGIVVVIMTTIVGIIFLILWGTPTTSDLYIKDLQICHTTTPKFSIEKTKECLVDGVLIKTLK